MIKLKNLEIKSGVVQSPMAGCTDLAYRLLSREYGMEFSFLEMVSAEALVRKNAGTEELMKTVPADAPLGAQIVGCRPEAMGEAARMVEDLGYALLDINFGCPVPKIYGNGAGSALLNRPIQAREIFKAMRKGAKTIPLTVKMRLGVNDPSGAEAAQIAKIAEEEGLDAVSVHGRTRAQGYSGSANYEAIGRVKAAVNIPVFGNGDINSGEDALRMKKIAGVDGVMVGRGGLGNPWLFKKIEASLEGRVDSREPSFEEKKKALLKHFELELAHRDEQTAVLHMRRIACWYFKNLPGSAEFRGKLNFCKTASELRTLIDGFGPSI
jgi:tRNA-dihydrouridine synthase B